MKKTILVGTRKSPLALAQVREILTALQQIDPTIKTKIIKMDTVGDKDKKTPISDMEGTDFFTKEIDEALLDRSIDCAIHSAKDLPDVMPEGIEIAATTVSVDPYDVLVSKHSLKLAELPKGARVGTSSERRKNQLKAYRSDLKIVDIRGTMQERLDTLKSPRLDAIVIAGAGLIRLGLGHHITEKIRLDILEPHPLQGSLAVTIRKGDEALKRVFSKLDGKKIAAYPEAPTKTCLSRTRRKNILVTGTSIDRFRHEGNIIHVPMIELKPVKSFRLVDATIKRLSDYDALVFTSRHAVKFFLEHLKKRAGHLKGLREKEIIAIGKTTARELADFGVKATRVAKEESAEGIVQMLKNVVLKGKRYLMPRSSLSNNRMVETLRKRGAKVDPVTVYRNVPAKFRKLDFSGIDEIIFTSPSTVKNFMKRYKQIARHCEVKAIGPVTQACLKSYEIKSEIIKNRNVYGEG